MNSFSSFMITMIVLVITLCIARLIYLQYCFCRVKFQNSCVPILKKPFPVKLYLDVTQVSDIANSDGRRITPSKLGKKFGFYYSDWPLLAYAWKLKLANRTGHPDILDFLNVRSLLHLLIKHMGTVGYGVFTLQPIKKDKVVGIYGGEYRVNQADFDFDEYLYRVIDKRDVHESEIFSSLFSLNVQKIISLGRYINNYTSIFQDLPTEAFLSSQYHLFDVDITDIATANLAAVVYRHHGFPLVVFKTTRDIIAGEQLGFQYTSNDSYWIVTMSGNKNFDRKLFYKNSTGYVEQEKYQRI